MKIILAVLLSAFAHLAGAVDVNTLMPIPNRLATVTLQTGAHLVAGRYREDILLATAAILEEAVFGSVVYQEVLAVHHLS